MTWTTSSGVRGRLLALERSRAVADVRRLLALSPDAAAAELEACGQDDERAAVVVRGLSDSTVAALCERSPELQQLTDDELRALLARPPGVT